MKDKKSKKIAILATNGFEESELKEPMKALIDAGINVQVISPEEREIKGWKDGNWSDKPVKVDKTLNDSNSHDFDGLILPGGVINPDVLRDNQAAVSFVKDFLKSEELKPVAAICHGPWLLIETGYTKNRKVTSYNSIKTDLINSGAKWVDEPVVIDERIITSRSPEDLGDFISAFKEAINNEKISEEAKLSKAELRFSDEILTNS